MVVKQSVSLPAQPWVRYRWSKEELFSPIGLSNSKSEYDSPSRSYGSLKRRLRDTNINT